jgi:hypothetical protein
MNIVNILDILGYLIQQNVVLLSLDLKNMIILIDSGLSFSLYVISIYFAFQAYREFKGIALDIIKASSSDQGFSLEKAGEVNYQQNTIELKTPKKDLQFL